jgi:hypothetical protein
MSHTGYSKPDHSGGTLMSLIGHIADGEVE